MEIPVVDCNVGGISAHGKEIFDAIATVGFVYLKNAGIRPEKVSQLFAKAGAFWALSDEQKAKFARPKDYENEGNTGYVAPDVEHLNPDSAAELREAFNYLPADRLSMEINENVAGFVETLNEFYSNCWDVSLLILRVLAKHLGLEENFFDKNHCIRKKGATTLRLLHYPPLPEDIKPGTVRCGEHSDYGSITLLFQDNIGGLEVSRRDGTFIPAIPVADAVLVNTGDLLQRWTSDRIKAVRHRVLIPEDISLYKSDRYAIAFFVHPNDEEIVRPLDGSNKYAPVTARQHLLDMFKRSY